MRSSSDQLKNRLFNIDQYNNIIDTFKHQLSQFGPSEKKMLRRGRHRKFFQELEGCIKLDGTKKDQKMTCLKESLHKECIENFNDMKKCVEGSKNKNQCNHKLGDYFICIDGSIKEILMSSTIDY